MLRIEVVHNFDVSVAEAFAYITDMKNWPEYWPDFIRFDNPAATSWSNPGDSATVVIKLLNRERALNMEFRRIRAATSLRVLESTLTNAQIRTPDPFQYCARCYGICEVSHVSAALTTVSRPLATSSGFSHTRSCTCRSVWIKY